MCYRLNGRRVFSRQTVGIKAGVGRACNVRKGIWRELYNNQAKGEIRSRAVLCHPQESF